MERLSILVNSCDRYEEVWNPFFTLLFKYWKSKDIPRVFLNTETKSYCNYEVTSLNSKEESWSSRLIESLNKIGTTYVLLLLDDFFIMENINVREIYNILSLLDSNKEVGGVYLKKIAGSSNLAKYDDRYLVLDKKMGKYYLNFQASIFRKDVLLKMLVPQYSPWEIEENAKYNTVDEILLCDSVGDYKDCSNDTIPYLWALESGYGICKSKWLWNNGKLFKRNNVSYERKELGYISHLDYLCQKTKHFLIKRK